MPILLSLDFETSSLDVLTNRVYRSWRNFVFECSRPHSRIRRLIGEG